MDLPITANLSDSTNPVSFDLPVNPNLNHNDSQSSDSDSDDTSSENYEVEAILDMRTKKGIKEYKIKWKDYPLDSCTWEPEENLNCPEKLTAFLKKRKEDSAASSQHNHQPSKLNKTREHSSSREREHKKGRKRHDSSSDGRAHASSSSSQSHSAPDASPSTAQQHASRPANRPLGPRTGTAATTANADASSQPAARKPNAPFPHKKSAPTGPQASSVIMRQPIPANVPGLTGLAAAARNLQAHEASTNRTSSKPKFQIINPPAGGFGTNVVLIGNQPTIVGSDANRVHQFPLIPISVSGSNNQPLMLTPVHPNLVNSSAHLPSLPRKWSFVFLFVIDYEFTIYSPFGN
jgi:hypothetical protein